MRAVIYITKYVDEIEKAKELKDKIVEALEDDKAVIIQGQCICEDVSNPNGDID